MNTTEVYNNIKTGNVRIQDFPNKFVGCDGKGGKAYELTVGDATMIVRLNKNGTYTWIS